MTRKSNIQQGKSSTPLLSLVTESAPINAIGHYEPQQYGNEGQVKLLGSNLMYALQIPESDNLVLILGNGTEDNNADALQTWTGRHLSDIAHLNTIEQFQHLKNLLAGQLYEACE